jgi:hypothetical protein
VLATPVYLPLPGEMQNIINRLIPLIEPILEVKDGRTRAVLHEEINLRRIVLVSVCGWWEMGNFDTVLRIIQEMAKDMACEFSGAVLRPHAHLMKTSTEKPKAVNHALRQVGSELVTSGKMSKDLLRIISQPLISEEEYQHNLTSKYLKAKAK